MQLEKFFLKAQNFMLIAILFCANILVFAQVDSTGAMTTNVDSTTTTTTTEEWYTNPLYWLIPLLLLGLLIWALTRNRNKAVVHEEHIDRTTTNDRKY